MQYTPSKVMGLMKDFKKDLEIYERVKEDFKIGVPTGASAPKYGIEAAMPSGNGTSDPTFQTAQSLMENPKIIRDLRANIEFISERSKRIYKPQHQIVFTLRIQGCTCKYIADKIGNIGVSRVSNILNEIAQLMCKSDEEYKLYCKKNKITPVK